MAFQCQDQQCLYVCRGASGGAGHIGVIALGLLRAEGDSSCWLMAVNTVSQAGAGILSPRILLLPGFATASGEEEWALYKTTDVVGKTEVCVLSSHRLNFSKACIHKMCTKMKWHTRLNVCAPSSWHFVDTGFSQDRVRRDLVTRRI